MDSQSPLIFNDDSPLHVAVRQGQIEDVRSILFQQQVDVNILNYKRETPLHLACSQRDSNIVQLLIAFGADPYIKDSNDNTAYARSSYDINTLMNRLLFCHGLWINSPTQTDGDSPLHTAVKLGILDDVKRMIMELTVNVDGINTNHETPLHLACALGHKNIVHILISKGANMYIRDCYNNAPIHRAVSQGHVDIFDCLITDCACDPKTRGYQGRTLLHFACGIGNAELAITLIEKYGISPMATDAVNQTPLHIAASHDQEEIVCLLISKFNCPVDSRSNDKLSPLHLASYCGHVFIVKTLVHKYKADVNALDEAGYAPLLKAVFRDNIDLVQLMVEDFDLNIQSTSGDTPLHVACMYGHEELVRLLINKYSYSVDVKNKNEETPIHKAVLCGQLDMMQVLISDFGCSPQAKGFEGRSLLHYACDRGHTKLAKMLIADFKLNPFSADDSGNTPLHMACLGGHEELARLLITKYNCPVDVKNNNNETPLHWACSFGHLGVVRMLVSEFKANNDARSYQNSTPISVAVLGGHTAIVQMLITEYGCSAQVKGFKGRSLLHCACEKGHTKLAMILITDFKLDPLSAADNGNTPLHIACGCGHEELARLLITKYNCSVDIINIKDGGTPLHYACLCGHSSVVRVLVSEFKANLMALDHWNDTPVSKAALSGHADVVQMLITEFGCSPQAKGFEGRSLLHQACSKRHTKLAMNLITDFKLDPLSADEYGNTPLHIACWCGHEELARLLITKYNCPVDIKNKNKQTPLHKACSGGHLDVSKVLASEYIMPKSDKSFCNTLDKDGNTPLDLVIKKGDAKAVHTLSAEYGCKPHVKGAESKPLLHQLAAGGFVTMLKELISNFNHKPASVDENRNTILHTAAQHGQLKVVEFLVSNHSNQCRMDHRNSQGQTALHCACMGGHTRVAKFLVASKADITVKDEDGDTPFKKAFLTGHVLTFFELFDSNLHTVDSKLLHQVCVRGSVDLIDILLSDFNLDPFSVLDKEGNQALHIATLQGHKQVIVLLINKYKCPVDSRNFSGQTPLHLLCSQLPTENGYTLINMFIMEFKADVTSKDKKGDQPIHTAVQAGFTSTVISLILDHKCSPNFRGFKQRNLLHHALATGHTSTAKTLIEVFLNNLSLHCIDNDGNTPLHLSSLYGQPESVRLLLYDYHAPIHVRNKAGKTALDLATEDFIKKMFREYASSEYKRIQQEYDKLRTKSLQKYSGKQIITRVFVLGNPGSGKSTLVESLKRKGILSSFFTVTEADVPPHTAGIVPSVHQSKEAGRLLYYDFAGDKEYFSSHAAILEIVSHLNIGSNVYFIIADSRKDDITIHNEIGYWLSFISYHGKALVSQYRMKIIVILSHSDHLSLTDSDGKVESMRQYLHAHVMNQYHNDEIFDIVEVVSSNCRSPRSSRSIETILQQISKDTPPCSISYETSLLHGMLEKDFSNVVACKFQDLLSNIKDTGICLPTVPDALYPIVKELHDIGLLMMIGRSEDRLEDYLLLLDLSSLTHEVHQLLFSSSESVIQNFNSSTSPHHYADMGILPESYLASVLPEHITKECLVQLQYCQEFSCAEVGLDSSAVSSSGSVNNLLYFPALCKLDSEKSNWPTDPQLNFAIGWYAKCTGKFDYFPARFLHVLLLRLAFAFALPIANCNITESNEISAHNRRCTMWKNGIRWLMEEGVECMFEMVNDNKGIVVITKSKKTSKERTTILTKIIDKVIQAKAEFCSPISLHHFLLKSDNTSSFKNNDNLFEITEVEKVIREGKEMVVSVSGRAFLDSSHLFMFRKYTFWGLNFPMNISTILLYIRGIVEEWEQLGMALQVPIEILREINIDRSLVASKKEEMIMKWMNSPGPACWWLLVKALEEIDQNVAAAAIRTEQGEIIEIQQKLIEGGDQKPDDAFLQSFARVVGDRWPSLASLLSITAREIEEIKREEIEQQALCMLTKWSTKEEATFKQLHRKLQTVYLFRC